MRKTLAPTAELATPRVRKFIESKLLPRLFGESAVITDFYLCEPATNLVSSREETWIEANWGLEIEAERFCVMDFDEVRESSTTVGIGDASVCGTPNPFKIAVSLWLYAKVMRE